MNNEIKTWNFNDFALNNPEKKFWVMWGFIDKNDFYFNNDNIEVKWWVHKKWEYKIWTYHEKSVKNIWVLISGKCKMIFPDTNKEILIENQWDYIAFDSSSEKHNFEAIEDTIFMTIRIK